MSPGFGEPDEHTRFVRVFSTALGLMLGSGSTFRSRYRLPSFFLTPFRSDTDGFTTDAESNTTKLFILVALLILSKTLTSFVTMSPRIAKFRIMIYPGTSSSV